MSKTLLDFDVKNKKVLVRCDFDVPLDENGNIADDFRIRASLPTINYLIEKNAKIILMSHLGEPGGKIESILSLSIVKKKIEELLGVFVEIAADCVGEEVVAQTAKLMAGQVLLLENLRFHKEETENNAEFAEKLAKLGDIYINDAFAVCHRAHASIVGVPKFLPAGAGFLLEKEITTLLKIMENSQRPMIVLMGGKKVETKTGAIDRLLEIADLLIINGLIKREIIEKKLKFNNEEKIIAPADNLGAPDINEETAEFFKKKILSAKTVLWNGPFGKFEDEEHKKGTLAIATAIIKSGAFSVVGGGETIEFLTKEGIISKFSHVSTGGGAMLQFLSGEELPGIKALEQEL